MASSTKYAIGDKLSVVDLNGKVYRLIIASIGTYSVVKQLGNIEVLAQQYPSPHDTVDTANTLFYVCESIAGETATFSQLILWDDVINNLLTRYITTKSVYRLDIVPIPLTTGTAARTIEAIMTDIKAVLAENVPDATINYTDITDETASELDMMKSAVELGLQFFDEITELETIRPLISDLKSINFTTMTTDIVKMISNIQARLALIDAGGSNLAGN